LSISKYEAVKAHPKPSKFFKEIRSSFSEEWPIWRTGAKKQMINPVSSASVVTPTVQSAPQPKAQQAASAEPKDTVHLSSQAKAQASGDADHDGDSH
jgi:hypothetical protein